MSNKNNKYLFNTILSNQLPTFTFHFYKWQQKAKVSISQNMKNTVKNVY